MACHHAACRGRAEIGYSVFFRLMWLLRSNPSVLKNDSRSVESQRTDVYTRPIPIFL